MSDVKKEIDQAISWLRCHEHVEHGLIMQCEASDWADIMPRSGQVLYSNALWCQPPDNNIHGNYASHALHQCWTQHLWPLIQQLNPAVIVPLGNTALRQFFPEGEILGMRGYVQPWRTFNLLPSVHPSYILRGNPHFASVLIRDLQAAVELAENGMQHFLGVF